MSVHTKRTTKSFTKDFINNKTSVVMCVWGRAFYVKRVIRKFILRTWIQRNLRCEYCVKITVGHTRYLSESLLHYWTIVLYIPPDTLFSFTALSSSNLSPVSLSYFCIVWFLPTDYMFHEISNFCIQR